MNKKKTKASSSKPQASSLTLDLGYYKIPQTTERGKMSTRSNIAIEDPKTKKVKVIYVHSDGYPYGVGQCLVDNNN